MRRFALILMVLAGGLVGCQKNTPPPAAPAASSVPPLPTHAQGKLQTIRVWLGTEELQTELALTPEEERTGMMFRTNMPENTAMLFALGEPQRADFWMKNCPLPLSAAYIDPSGTILEIHDLHPFDTNGVLANSDNILYVIEANQGWFERHHVPVGSVVRTEAGSMAESFRRRR